MENVIRHTCKSCGHSFEGNYCNQCGEKVLHASDRSFKKLVSDIVQAVTFADSKLLKTVWIIVKNPGFISKEFADGKRVNYMSPLSLFFVTNLIYFLFPVIQLFNASLHTQLFSPLGGFYRKILTTKLVSLGIDLNSFTLIYNLKTVALAKLLVMVFVVISSFPLNILYRKHNRYFTDHVGYMVELACFNLLINALLLSILAAALGIGKYLNETSLTLFFVGTNLYFVIRSSHEFYKEHGISLVVKSMLVVLFLKVALELYRAILFFVTIWSL